MLDFLQAIKSKDKVNNFFINLFEITILLLSLKSLINAI